MQEDAQAGMIYAFLEDYTGDRVCSKQLYAEALGNTNIPAKWETRAICEIMNTGISRGDIQGWQAHKTAKRYPKYGCNNFFGKFSSANFNFTCLDVCEIHIGDNVMIGPNVTLATPMHPLLPEERNIRKREDGSFYNLEYAKPITIKDNCWLASNVVVCGGVTIGEGCVIGAGSVVTRDIPSGSLAAGNPCRVIRKITENDHL